MGPEMALGGRPLISEPAATRRSVISPGGTGELPAYSRKRLP